MSPDWITIAVVRTKQKSRRSKSRDSQAVGTTWIVAGTKFSAKAAKLPPSPCPNCKEMHWIRDCPKATTEAEKDELRKALREQVKANRSRLKRLDEPLPISGHEMTVNGVRLHLLIHTAVGPVEPMSTVDVLIADVDDNEFIMGDDLLLTLGIDVDRQLDMLADCDSDEASGDHIELEADDSPVAATSSSDEDTIAAVEPLLDRALENRFPVDRLEILRIIAHAYDIWHLELGDDPPASVPPMEVRLRDGARPVKCKPRKYPPHIRQFLREFNSQLVALGLVYENPDTAKALTDIRAAMRPILSLAVEPARGMNHFGLFDFLKGFAQLSLAELCQELLSYMTDEIVFTPRRVPQGSSDAAIFFQQFMEKCFDTLLYEYLLIGIDDLLLYANDINVYLDKLAELFSLLNQFGLKLKAKKSSLYQTQVKWCGKVIDGQGIRHDTERVDSLRSLPYPRTAGELQQFVRAINRVRESIIDYARRMDPLQRHFDAALVNTMRTRRAAVSIEIELTDNERQTFDGVKEALATAATLDFPDDTATTCLFIDVSDVG
ncbi:unnamed protein product [Phytophthora fragariaefolia]|uniref:Unnamed protein product n=1 Tax=Phytophthora fragariaefolia TaxID=1490495 RepID=A0A9W6TVF5_9STRA|nr:unnamed protein product [Phytophthora fragariaefolia]